VTHVQYDFDASRKDPNNIRAGIELPEETADYAALLRHECCKRGIEVEFAQAGWGWLNPERRDRMEREFQRLSAPDVPAAAPASSRLMRWYDRLLAIIEQNRLSRAQ
jgi:hypothetical protein